MVGLSLKEREEIVCRSVTQSAILLLDAQTVPPSLLKPIMPGRIVDRPEVAMILKF